MERPSAFSRVVLAVEQVVVPREVNAIDLETKYGSTALWALVSETARVGPLSAGLFSFFRHLHESIDRTFMSG